MEDLTLSRIIDISMTIEESMQVWKSYEAKKPHITNVQNHDEGKPHESLLSLNVHTGTHVDAPLHMLAGGSTIESISLDRLVGPARVLDLTHLKGYITKEDLVPYAIQRDERLLFKTTSSLTEEFDLEFVFLREDGAQYLTEIGVGLVATDALGIERAQAEYPTHRTLMRNDIIIVEGLRLKDVQAGNYMLVIAPLKLTGIDASPARAFLIAD